MEKYLYLTKEAWAITWINGGSIPISSASSYRKAERSGTFTPDENLIHDSPVDLKSLSPFLVLEEGASVKRLTMQGNTLNGVPMTDFVNASYYEEDGLILSFSNSFSEKTALRLRKQACVKIKNINALKEHIDHQLGIIGKASACRYTSDHQRNHFLKSSQNSWQDEYRLFWPITEARTVQIPNGTAELVSIFGSSVGWKSAAP